MPWLINAGQLEKFRKSQKNVVVLDASWYLPQENKNARAEFIDSHIPGARFLDLTEFHDPNSPIPNMLSQDTQLIAERIAKLGITNEFKIIFYDKSHLHTSCRALWMFKVFGHNPFQLYVLDGGFNTWQRFGGKEESGEARVIAPKNYNVNYQHELVRTLAEMKQNVEHPVEQVIDVRHPTRFAGGADPRPMMRAGHIPGSFCLPYFSLFEDDGRFKPLDKTRKRLIGMGVDLRLPIVSTCGSGMTAPILDFVLDLLNHEDHGVYDGSWSEWGADKLYLGETSLAERPIRTSLDEEE